jgi:hypothetical protein
MKNFWNFRRENFNLRFKNHLFLFLSIALLWVSQSCKKDISSIGMNIKDSEDLLGCTFTDTITLTAFSILEDTLYTTNRTTQLLGYLQDNTFGSTTAGIYTQLVPTGRDVSFGNSPQLDSIVLTLRYTGNYYGDTLAPFIINIYELTDDILSTERYYQNTTLAHSATNLTYTPNFILYPKPTSKVVVDTLGEAHIRIRLSDALGNHFLVNSGEMQTNTNFKKFFKGLYIEVEPMRKGNENSGSLININLNNTLSGIRLYYKNDTISRRFYFPAKDISFTNFTHTYENGNSDFVNQVLHENQSLGEKQLYVQASGGVKTKITFPYIKHLKDKKIVINKAELVITNIEDDIILSNYPSPNRLSMYGINPVGNDVRLPDDPYFTNNAYWGGTYDSKTKEYRFRITRYIQDIIQNEKFEPYIYLVAEGAASNANRLVLGGTNPENASSKLRLEVYYTEY